jgi:NifU-like protein
MYPEAVQKRLNSDRAASTCEGVSGLDVNFSCGTFVEFTADIDGDIVRSLTFRTNGCGFMTASAEIVSRDLTGKALQDLNGPSAIRNAVGNELGAVPAERLDCIDTCLSAIKQVFERHRSRLAADFTGDKPLICTCFGITEERVAHAIETRQLTSVEDVTAATNAGRGCGSCLPLIREYFDRRPST